MIVKKYEKVMASPVDPTGYCAFNNLQLQALAFQAGLISTDSIIQAAIG